MFEVYESSTQLPERWDQIVRESKFLRRDTLTYLELVNPCSQRYYMNSEAEVVFVSYKLDLNLFTFSCMLKFSLPANIIGIPMSVSSCGYYASTMEGIKLICDYVKGLKGFYVILNSEDAMMLSGGNTLPSCVMEADWGSFEEYLSSMRSSYRHRVNKAVKKFGEIEVQELKNNLAFDETLYKLYIEVYENSREKLEKLSIGFFKAFPSKIFTFKLGEEPIAFVQLFDNKEELVFLFGGFKHSVNLKYDIYINMLLFIVRYGIDKGYKYINFGQTAEETKLKLGTKLVEKNMFVFHSNPIVNCVIRLFIRGFSYKGYAVKHQVFKSDYKEILQQNQIEN